MRGRGPKPSRIKASTGNPGKRPFNAHEPRPVPALPECPPELSPVARREWARLADLSKLNLAHTWIVALSLPLPQPVDFGREALRQIQKYGTMVKSPTGHAIQSPYPSIANRQAEIMMRVASEFGFTRANRSGISAPPADQLPLLDLTMADCEQEDAADPGS
jgi:phage terminase small subunit